ncbi:MAG: glycine zipper domain-containing protein [Rhodovibrionaceae bacterium]|nr:glycine zipper domain-containing protein [Rhodovibrionaceae bacterium]
MFAKLKSAVAMALSLMIAMPAVATGALAQGAMAGHLSHAAANGNPLLWQAKGPPPWAPAHGYRRKHGHHHHYYGHGYDGPLPLDFDLGRCNREAIGRILGGGAGAAIGSTIGDGRGRLVAIATGAIFGTLLGGTIGRQMDEADRYCMGTVFEHASDGERIVWDEPRREARYAVTPRETYQTESGRYCREYQAEAWVGGRKVDTYGTACRQPDGAWQIVN